MKGYIVRATEDIEKGKDIFVSIKEKSALRYRKRQGINAGKRNPCFYCISKSFLQPNCEFVQRDGIRTLREVKKDTTELQWINYMDIRKNIFHEMQK